MFHFRAPNQSSHSIKLSFLLLRLKKRLKLVGERKTNTAKNIEISAR